MTVIAIDFGTSNTVVCTQDPVTKEPRSLKFDRLSRTFESIDRQVHVVPTLVFVQGKEQFVLGEQVRSQRLGYGQPERLFRAFKRDLAADFRPPARQIDGFTYTAEDIAELFLTEIWQQLKQQKIEPSQVIFTVPVGAFEAYRDWFSDFAKELDFPDLKLVDESTAAALGYAIERPGAIVLVIDFGGGTLDLSLVRTASPQAGQQTIKAEVLAKSDAYIGGVDIDRWIVEYYLRSQNLTRTDINQIGWQNLIELAEKMKIQLSQSESARESWFDDENFISYELKLDRSEFADILESRQLLEQLRQAVDEVLGIAVSRGIGKNEIEQVLLVGGSCQIPAVQQLIVSYFGRQRVKLDKPFEAVAYGALVLGQTVEVDDYLRHGYAIRLWEPHTKTYSYFTLFDRGTRYPCQSYEPLILQAAVEGQKDIRLDIGEVAEMSQAEVIYDLQGRMSSSQLNRHSDFRSLADVRQIDSTPKDRNAQQVCIAHLNPAGQLGIDRIDVRFEVNDRRMLIATVKDLLTQKILVDRASIAKLN